MNFLIGEDPVLKVSFRDEIDFWCRSIYFLRYFGKLTSAWLIVTITLERYIGVAHPLKAGRISTRTNAKIIISCIYIASFALSCFPFWTIGIQEHKHEGYKFCSYLKKDEYDKWNWVINRIGSLLLPSILIFIVTTMIIAKLHQMAKKRENLMGSHNNGNANIQKQLTLMLVTVSITFLILRLPYLIAYYLYDFRYKIWQPIDLRTRQNLFGAYRITDALETLNYGINFFLYCFSGSAFRNQFLALLCCRRNVLGRNYKGGSKTATVANTLSTSLRSINKLSPLPGRASVNVISSTNLDKPNVVNADPGVKNGHV